MSILGRAKRFAKIGGEMVSLAAAEELAAALWPEDAHAVIAEPDARKGERLVLVTTRRDAEAGALLARRPRAAWPEIMVPRVIAQVEAIPLLGTGKTDYPGVERCWRRGRRRRPGGIGRVGDRPPISLRAGQTWSARTFCRRLKPL